MIKERKSNIELLRIIAILLIISFHYVYKSGFAFETLNYNSFVVKTFYHFGELGVNLFVLISGYFMIKGKFSMKKLIKLIVEVNFYYIASSIIFEILCGNLSNLIRLKSLELFFSVIFERYWFVTAYVLLYVLSPFLNKLINSFKKNDYKKFLFVLLFIWSIIPTFFGLLKNGTEQYLYYNRFIWLIVMYFIGAYIRLYSINFFKKRKNALKVMLVSFIVMELGIIIIYLYKDIFARLGTTEVAYFWQPNSIPMVLLSVSIFYIFINIDIKKNNIINLFASTTLGVYMLHDGVLNSYIWEKIFKTNYYLHSSYPIFHIVVSAIIIFVSFALIDIFRQFIEKYTLDKLLNTKLYTKLENKCKNIYHKISKFV